MTGALEMTCVFDRHYGLKTHFSSKKLLFGRFIGQKVRFQTIVPVKKTCNLRVWGKSPFDFQNFEKILRHILKYRNCSNLERSLLSTIKSYGANGSKLKNFYITLGLAGLALLMYKCSKLYTWHFWKTIVMEDFFIFRTFIWLFATWNYLVKWFSIDYNGRLRLTHVKFHGIYMLIFTFFWFWITV